MLAAKNITRMKGEAELDFLKRKVSSLTEVNKNLRGTLEEKEKELARVGADLAMERQEAKRLEGETREALREWQEDLQMQATELEEQKAALEETVREAREKEGTGWYKLLKVAKADRNRWWEEARRLAGILRDSREALIEASQGLTNRLALTLSERLEGLDQETWDKWCVFRDVNDDDFDAMLSALRSEKPGEVVHQPG